MCDCVIFFTFIYLRHHLGLTRGNTDITKNLRSNIRESKLLKASYSVTLNQAFLKKILSKSFSLRDQSILILAARVGFSQRPEPAGAECDVRPGLHYSTEPRLRH